MARRLSILTALAVLGAFVATPARAAEPCELRPRVNAIVGGGPVYESVGFDRRGRLFFSGGGELLMIRRHGDDPVVIVDGVDGTGGIVARRDGKLLMGFGNTVDQASDGELSPDAGLLRVNPRRRRARIWVEGLTMANGVVRGPGRTIYASNDIAGGIDRVDVGDGRSVTVGWSDIDTPNGLEIDPANRRFLYAVQTFAPAAVQRIDLANPANVSAWYTAPPADVAAGFDGTFMTRSGSLYVAANGAGQVWRIDGPGDACVLADRDPFPAGPSDLAFGRGKRGFERSSLYVTTFGGELLELEGAR